MPQSPVSTSVQTRDLAEAHHISLLVHAFRHAFLENTGIKVTGRGNASFWPWYGVRIQLSRAPGPGKRSTTFDTAIDVSLAVFLMLKDIVLSPISSPPFLACSCILSAALALPVNWLLNSFRSLHFIFFFWITSLPLLWAGWLAVWIDECSRGNWEGTEQGVGGGRKGAGFSFSAAASCRSAQLQHETSRYYSLS